jgi:hypothetical protein
MPMDALKAGWILITFLLVFLWFPARLFSGRVNRVAFLGIAGNWARMSLLTVTAIFILSRLRILSAITVGFLLAIGFVVAWLQKHYWELGSLTDGLKGTILQLLRNLETHSVGPGLLRLRPNSSSNPHSRRGTNGWSVTLQENGLLFAPILVVVAITGVLRFANAWQELRLERVEQYAYLLQARELLLNLSQIGRPFVFPSLITTTSLLSAVDPMQVTRFLSPLMGILFVLALGLFLQACMRVRLASIVAMYCLGAAACPPLVEQQMPAATSVLQKLGGLFALSSPAAMRGGTEFELGVVFALLGLAFLAEWSRNPNRDLLVDAACCVLLTGLVSTLLLQLLAITAVFVLLRPWLAPVVFVLCCYGLAAYALLSSGAGNASELFPALPLAAAMAVGCLLAAIFITLRLELRKDAQRVLLVACLVLAVAWFTPHRLSSQPLEYEAAARQTQEIAQKFSAQKWVVVAPVEQLPETLGFGGYEDLATFVEKYRAHVSSPEFHFSGMPQDVFIYVETRPFQMFSQEPLAVSFAVLTDSTYRSYRSPAGRASLEFEAWQLCENYRQYHSDMEVYFQDDHLLIYRIHSEGGLKAGTEERRAAL